MDGALLESLHARLRRERPTCWDRCHTAKVKRGNRRPADLQRARGREAYPASIKRLPITAWNVLALTGCIGTAMRRLSMSPVMLERLNEGVPNSLEIPARDWTEATQRVAARVATGAAPLCERRFGLERHCGCRALQSMLVVKPSDKTVTAHVESRHDVSVFGGLVGKVGSHSGLAAALALWHAHALMPVRNLECCSTSTGNGRLWRTSDRAVRNGIEREKVAKMAMQNPTRPAGAGAWDVARSAVRGSGIRPWTRSWH